MSGSIRPMLALFAASARRRKRSVSPHFLPFPFSYFFEHFFSVCVRARADASADERACMMLASDGRA
jgi:hypothetical protein